MAQSTKKLNFVEVYRLVQSKLEALKTNPDLAQALEPFFSADDDRFEVRWIRGLDVPVNKITELGLPDLEIVALKEVSGTVGEQQAHFVVSYYFMQSKEDVGHYSVAIATFKRPFDVMVEFEGMPIELENFIVEIKNEMTFPRDYQDRFVLGSNPFPQRDNTSCLSIREIGQVLETLLFKHLRRVPSRLPTGILFAWGKKRGYREEVIHQALCEASRAGAYIIEREEGGFVFRRSYLDTLIFD